MIQGMRPKTNQDCVPMGFILSGTSPAPTLLLVLSTNTSLLLFHVVLIKILCHSEPRSVKVLRDIALPCEHATEKSLKLKVKCDTIFIFQILPIQEAEDVAEAAVRGILCDEKMVRKI